jgi:transposase
MWVFLGGPPGKKVVFYNYSESRGGSVAADFLGDYQGCVQSDGYSAYDFLDHREGVIHAGCWAHVRRKFCDVTKLAGKMKKSLGKAGEALRMINEFYRIEREAATENLTLQELVEVRQKISRPKVKAFFDWIQENALSVAGSGSLGAAFTYTLKQKNRLEKFLEYGVLRMDNNLAENAIRPFVVGRKNWLFSDQPHGASASAVLYSLIETAKVNNLEPYRYLLFLFDKLPMALREDGSDSLKRLLPFNVTEEMLEEHKNEYFKRKGSHLI